MTATTVIPKSRSLHWRSEGLTIDLEMDDWGKDIAAAVLEHTIDQIQLGNKPSGEPQPPLSRTGQAGRRAAKGLRPDARGFTNRARFIKSLRVQRHKVTRTKAEYFIATSPFFHGWLSQEEGRGAEYFSVEGAVQKIVDKVVAKRAAKMAK